MYVYGVCICNIMVNIFIFCIDFNGLVFLLFLLFSIFFELYFLLENIIICFLMVIEVVFCFN